jgi:hypothetical protein
LARCYIVALDELRLHTQMYPKLPPLRSSEIEWDPVDSPVSLPPASGVSRSQTRRQHDDRPFRATKSSNIKLELQDGNPIIQSESADVEPKVQALKAKTQ